MTISRPAAPPAAIRRLLAPASLVVLAFVARIVAVHVNGGGGLGGVYGYDAGVYYAASDSLLQGDLPYRDFVLLHPPGLMLALTPFAALGRLTSDHTGYVVANLVFVLMSAVNAGLVYGVARRLGAGARAACLGGAFYAVWFAAILAEVSLRLEPLAAFVALLAAFLLARPAAGRHAAVAAGALLGFATCVKIWWAVPVVAVAVVLVVARRPLVRAYLLGAVVTSAAVVLPFLLAAPSAMWHMVVADQIGRPDGGATGRPRYLAMTTLANAHLRGTAGLAGLVLVGALVVLLVARAVRTPAGRVVAGVFVVQGITLLLSPTYFSFYGGYLAPAAALLVATSDLGVSLHRVRGLLPAAVAVASAAALTLASLQLTRPISTPFPRAALGAAVAGARCVGTDSPIVLIQLDVLTRNLQHGCPNWVDVTGRTYGTAQSKRGIPRRRNTEWQAELLAYLRSNDVVLVVRHGTEPSRSTRAVIRSWPVVRQAGRVFVRQVPR